VIHHDHRHDRWQGRVLRRQRRDRGPNRGPNHVGDRDRNRTDFGNLTGKPPPFACPLPDRAQKASGWFRLGRANLRSVTNRFSQVPPRKWVGRWHSPGIYGFAHRDIRDFEKQEPGTYNTPDEPKGKIENRCVQTCVFQSDRGGPTKPEIGTFEFQPVRSDACCSQAGSGQVTNRRKQKKVR